MLSYTLFMDSGRRKGSPVVWIIVAVVAMCVIMPIGCAVLSFVIPQFVTPSRSSVIAHNPDETEVEASKIGLTGTLTIDEIKILIEQAGVVNG